MSYSRLKKFGIKPRRAQGQFIDALQDAETKVHHVSFIHADTGIGKSLGLLSAALDWVDAGYRVIIATCTHKLIRQLAQVELQLIAPEMDFGIYYGLSSYPSRERIECLLAVENFDQSTISYLEALSLYAGCIEDFVAEYGPLPDGISENQLHCMYGDDNYEVKYERELALKKSLVFTTHASLIQDGLYDIGLFELEQRTAVLIDEGDAFIDQVESARFQFLSIREVVEYLQEHASKKILDPLNQLVLSMTQIAGEPRSDLHSALARRFFDTVKDVAKGRAKWKLEFRRRFQPFFRYYPDVCLAATKVRKYPQIAISRPYVNSKIGQYLRSAHHAVLVSGTLSIKNGVDGMDWAVSCLRLDDAVGVKAQFSPDHFGSLTFSLAASDESYPDVYVNNGELAPRWINRLTKEICTYAASQSVVVLTGSHRESEALELSIKQDNPNLNVCRHKCGESIKEAASRFLLSGGIFITAAGHTGLNLVEQDGKLAFKVLFITRIGMAPKDDEKAQFVARMQAEFRWGADVERLKVTFLRHEYSRNIVRSVRRIRQAIGRAIRAEDHQAHIVICDPRFPLYGARDSHLSMLREAIPSRFREAYQAASQPQKKKLEVLF